MFCVKEAIRHSRNHGFNFFKKQSQRKYSNKIIQGDDSKIRDQESKIAIISGAGGQTAQTPILKLREAGYKVIALTGSEGKEKHNSEFIQYVKIDRNQLDNRDYVVGVVKHGLDQLNVTTCTKFVGVNLIGGSIAPSVKELTRMNFDIPMVFFESVSQLGRDVAGSTSLLQISSIAATINGDSDCTYAGLKKKTDEFLLGLSLPGGRAVALRPGIILPNPTIDGRVNMGHDYSPEQFCNWKFLPIIGSGKQIQQPVSEECLYLAGINALESDEMDGIIVNAVGPSTMTQKQLFAFFNSKAKYFMHIPPHLAMELANNVPLGRLAPYSAKMFAVLDEDESRNIPIAAEGFNCLLNGTPKAIHEVYDPKKVIVGRKAPIGKHCSMIGRYVLTTNPLSSIQFIGNLGRHFSSTTISKICEEDRLHSENNS